MRVAKQAYNLFLKSLFANKYIKIPDSRTVINLINFNAANGPKPKLFIIFKINPPTA